MKKIVLMAAVVSAAMSFTACSNSGKADLKEGVDSLTYDLGVAQSQGLKQYMSMQLGVDSTYLDEFIKGMKEGAINEADPKKEAYMKGLEVGKQIQQMAKGLSNEIYDGDSTQTVNVNNLLAGFIDGLKGTATITAEEAMNQFKSMIEPIQAANLEKKYGDNKAAGIKYLAENKKKEGVKTVSVKTDDGGVAELQYKVLTEGTGALPSDTSKVKVLYEGKLIDGTVFDSTSNRDNEPFEVDLKTPRVIKGWAEVLKLMPAGSKWEVTIPQELAYGSNNMGQIKPFSTLIFTIEVLK
ncbi:MAG: FKBP-type peptidyl-prolyl cis-trans isomerase [Bacteroidaceae bacterium]|nr:FKBP-type peptidyl-prolyl cis-trans isomerase [Bacteroidaceae bacterium]